MYKKWNLINICLREIFLVYEAELLLNTSRLSKLRNAKLQDCRLSYAVNNSWCTQHHFLITTVFSLASVLLSSACVKHTGDYGGCLEIAEELFLRQIRNITRIQVEPGYISLLCVSTRRFLVRSDSRSYSRNCRREGRAIIKLFDSYIGYFF